MIEGRQVQAARALLGWSQQELADKAVVSRNALNRFETGQVDARTSTVEAILKALMKSGIEFIDEGGYKGVRLRTRKA